MTSTMYRKPGPPPTQQGSNMFTPGKVVAMILGAVLFVSVLLFGTSLFEKVDQNEILVVQGAWNGKLHWYTSAGTKPQWFGRTTTFPKVLTYKFKAPIRFNEGGHGELIGSIQFRLPLDSATLTNIYTTYGSAEALQNNLIQVVTDKSVLSTGPLLSSTESYAEKRSNLLLWVEDQIVAGVYRTTRRDIRTHDQITGEERTVTVAEISTDAAGRPLRQESSQLTSFGLVPFNFAVQNIMYDARVEKQIQTQQENAMAVQTARAQSLRAEQQALTAEQQGRADATKARWVQEALKATAVTEAQQLYEVAALDARTADQERLANERRGAGEAARRRLVMQADNALDQKAKVWLEAQRVWASAFAAYTGQLVPSVVMGGNGQGGATSNITAFLDLIMARTARDLGLDMTMPKHTGGTIPAANRSASTDTQDELAQAEDTTEQ